MTRRGVRVRASRRLVIRKRCQAHRIYYTKKEMRSDAPPLRPPSPGATPPPARPHAHSHTHTCTASTGQDGAVTSRHASNRGGETRDCICAHSFPVAHTLSLSLSSSSSSSSCTRTHRDDVQSTTTKWHSGLHTWRSSLKHQTSVFKGEQSLTRASHLTHTSAPLNAFRHLSTKGIAPAVPLCVFASGAR